MTWSFCLQVSLKRQDSKPHSLSHQRGCKLGLFRSHRDIQRKERPDADHKKTSGFLPTDTPKVDHCKLEKLNIYKTWRPCSRDWNSKARQTDCPNTSGQRESACLLPLVKAGLDRKAGSKTHHLRDQPGAQSYPSWPQGAHTYDEANYSHSIMGWGYS